mmetsp:Transcript_45204/g.98780  ORF Transcript_45204/g.98780 Transcript_45204/m.98780 type:complete len:883 (+) Transcript_45204:98-2746(+)
MAATARLRLNVSALAGEDVKAKFLVVVEAGSTLRKLEEKIQQVLRSKHNIVAPIQRVLNGLRALLPDDELLGHMFADGEEVYAVLQQDATMLMVKVTEPVAVEPTQGYRRSPSPTQGYRRAPSLSPARSPRQTILAPVGPANHLSHGDDPSRLGGVPPLISARQDPGGGPLRAVVHLPQNLLSHLGQQEESEDEEAPLPAPPAMTPVRQRDYPPLPTRVGDEMVSGPHEQFMAETMPFEVMRVDHPCEPVPLTTYDTDWLVESLTPRLREFILKNVQGDLITEPKFVPALGKYVASRFLQDSGSFVSIFMRPQATVGSDPSATMPVHYHISRHDILRFQRTAQTYIEAAQEHMDLFRGASRSLKALLDRNMSEEDHVNIMLPHHYQAFDEVEGLMMEVEKPMIQTNSSCRNPVIIVDTSGMCGKHLVFVKAALKRVLYAQMQTKETFQLIRFTPGTGEPRLWAKEMAPPTDAALEAAEDWIEGLTPATNGGKLLNAVHYAMAHQAVDEIYIISPGDIERRQHDALLLGIRQLNKKEVAIHTVGVGPEPPGELLLRNIAESNHGDFNMKSFEEGKAVSGRDSRWTSWRTNLVNEKSKELGNSFKKQQMSIGNQIRIVEVMMTEEGAKETGWRMEWRCAQRLLVCNDEEKQYNLGRDSVREMERRTSRTLSARVGGGYAYATEEPNLGLERLFEHKSAVPWTTHMETMAVGPKVPLPGAGEGRIPKFPPSGELLPLPPPDLTMPLGQPERRPRARSKPRSLGPAGQRKSGDWRPIGPKHWRPVGDDLANPWDPQTLKVRPAVPEKMRRPPSADRRPPSARRSKTRTSSADRAAGGSSPKGRSKTPTRGSPRAAKVSGSNARPATPDAAAPPPLPEGSLERRWSF